MVVAKHKQIPEIIKMVSPFSKVLVLGCGTCTTISHAGSMKEVTSIISSLKEVFPEKEFLSGIVKRQCEVELLEGIAPLAGQVGAILSLGCGVGMQALAERFLDKEILPGNDTSFIGFSPLPDEFYEGCIACGNCLLYLTGGFCPLSRCPKRLLNGPCGGVKGECCEVSPDLPCIWLKIVSRLSKLGRLSLLEEIQPPIDWRVQDTIGPRKLITR